MTTIPTPEQVLSCPMGDNDAGADTIGEYLVGLLSALWIEGAGFSGKRPFGNSDWDGDIIVALVRAGYVQGEIDEDGYLDAYDEPAVNELVDAAIRSLWPKGATK